MPNKATIAGVVLAGGQSRRMGGGDKCLRELAGRTLLARIVERARPQVAALMLNANGDPARFADFGLPVAADTVAGFAGPLAGVLTGLEWAREHAPGCAFVASFACDAPFVPQDLVARLARAVADDGADMSCAVSGGRNHPVFGLWPVRLADELRRAVVEEDIRKVDVWTARYRLARVEFAAAPVDPFFNVNRPDDFAAAAALLDAARAGGSRDMAAATIRIAHDADFRPLAFLDGTESRGLVVELLTDVLARIGHTPEFVIIPLAGHEAALRSGVVDALAFKSVIPEFAEIYDQSSPLLTTGGAWFGPRDNDWAGSDPPAGARVVTTGRGPLVGLLKRDHAHLVLSTVDSYAAALAAVVAGEADVAALNFHVGGHIARRDHADSIAVPAAPFERQPTAFCVLKGHHGDLLKAFDGALREAMGEGIGDRLERQWLGRPAAG